MAPPLATNTQLDHFTGTAPMFPLPSAAFFPQVVQPLHVFEERYRILTAHALQTERLIAMSVLQPGWEARYSRNDLPVEPVVCLAQIDVDQRLPDGRYVLLMRGLIRARIVAELPPDQPFRRAKLQLLPDVYAAQPAIDRSRRRRELLELFQQLHPVVDAGVDLRQLADGELSLGSLCDALAAAEPSDVARNLLNEPRVDVRSDLLLESLRRQARQAGSPGGFPPPFSAN